VQYKICIGKIYCLFNKRIQSFNAILHNMKLFQFLSILRNINFISLKNVDFHMIILSGNYKSISDKTEQLKTKYIRKSRQKILNFRHHDVLQHQFFSIVLK